MTHQHPFQNSHNVSDQPHSSNSWSSQTGSILDRSLKFERNPLMRSRKQLISYPFRIAFFSLIILWIVFLLSQIPFISFSMVGDSLRLGIVPRNFIGLVGIFTGPWIHADLNHLLSNQSLFLYLIFLSILKPGRERTTLFLLIATTGLGVWLFGMAGNHIGASGLIFALQGFNFFTSIYQRRWMILGTLTLFLLVENTFFHGIFGWLSFDGPPISYSSHISGLVCGILLARILRERTKP